MARPRRRARNCSECSGHGAFSSVKLTDGRYLRREKRVEKCVENLGLCMFMPPFMRFSLQNTMEHQHGRKGEEAINGP